MSVLVGKKAPDFNATVVMGNNEIKEDFNFYNHIKGEMAILFFLSFGFYLRLPFRNYRF